MADDKHPDQDDAPELDEQWAEDAHRYQGDRLVRRGKGRPPQIGRASCRERV